MAAVVGRTGLLAASKVQTIASIPTNTSQTAASPNKNALITRRDGNGSNRKHDKTILSIRCSPLPQALQKASDPTQKRVKASRSDGNAAGKNDPSTPGQLARTSPGPAWAESLRSETKRRAPAAILEIPGRFFPLAWLLRPSGATEPSEGTDRKKRKPKMGSAFVYP